MDKCTLKALIKSITHWEENLNLAKAGDYDQIEFNADSCALCYEFYQDYLGPNACRGCPVQQATGGHSCQKSPWSLIANMLTRWDFNYYHQCFSYHDVIVNAVALEVSFLKSLLPDNLAESNHT